VFDRIDVPQVPLERALDSSAPTWNIERIRLGSRLSVFYDVDDRAARCDGAAVPAAAAGENAVKHGIAPHAGPGSVTSPHASTAGASTSPCRTRGRPSPRSAAAPLHRAAGCS
jgi:LytS/YehU family sensor histidine kinase